MSVRQLNYVLEKLRGFARRPAMALWVLALCGCAPAVASHCSARNNGQMIATVTLTNRSLKEVVAVDVLVDAKSVHVQGGRGRLFGAATHLAPGETRTIEALPIDYNLYDFKFATNGCELEHIVFADGTSWEQPSPL